MASWSQSQESVHTQSIGGGAVNMAFDLEKIDRQIVNGKATVVCSLVVPRSTATVEIRV